ncbi:MAG: DUF3147 family protein [Bacillaceae bacterium]|nr:DUF3147 family protein [Bacillaceae bacterium]
MFFFLKIIISALIIGVVTEIARRFPTWGGIMAALPLVSLLSLFWLSVQGQSPEEMSRFARGVLWGFPATAVLLYLVSVGLKHSLSLYMSVFLGISAWGVLIMIQELMIKR